METGKISPIPKVDLFIAEGHFRPISILPTLSKVFERLVARKLLSITIYLVSAKGTLYVTIYSSIKKVKLQWWFSPTFGRNSTQFGTRQ